MSAQAPIDDLWLDPSEFRPLPDPKAHPRGAHRPLPTRGQGPQGQSAADSSRAGLQAVPRGNRPTRFSGIGLSTLLRGTGGLIIVAAFLAYLFRGWRDGDDLTRYILLLGHTGVLTLAGLALGHLLHEAKGARLFIALSLAAVPVNFAFLGGITYPHLTWDAPRAAGAVTSLWQSASTAPLEGGLALALAAGAAAALAIAVLFGFLVMARRSAWRLAGLYLLANGALLIPTRSETVVAAILLGLATTLAWAALSLRRRDPTLATPGGAFARAVLALPLLVMAGRSLWLYAPDALFFAALCLVGYLGLRQAIVATANDRRWLAWLEACALFFAGASAFLVFAAVIDLRLLSAGLPLPLAGALFAALMWDLASLGKPRSAQYRALGISVATLGAAANLVWFADLGNALIALAAGLATLAYGFAARHRGVFAIGVLAGLAGFGVAAQGALSAFTIGGWTALVLAGIAIVVAGSVLERHGPAIAAAWARWHRHFDRED